MKPIEMPLDYSRHPAFRRLVKALKVFPFAASYARVVADHLYLNLWVELGYQGSFHPLGWIGEAEFAAFLERFDIPSTKPELLTGLLVDSGVLVRQEDGFFSALFFHYNEGAARRISTRELRGRDAKAYAAKMRGLATRAEGMGAQLAALWPEETGKWDAETHNGAVMVIDALDAILQRPLRKPDAYGLGLFVDACKFFKRFGPERVNRIQTRLMAMRMEPEMPRTAERILQDIDEVMIAFEPGDGWIVWDRRQK